MRCGHWRTKVHQLISDVTSTSNCNGGHVCWTGHEFIAAVVIEWFRHVIDTINTTEIQVPTPPRVLPPLVHAHDFANVDGAQVQTSLPDSAGAFEPHGHLVGWHWDNDGTLGWISFKSASIAFYARSCKGSIVVTFLKTYEHVGECNVSVNSAEGELLHTTLNGLWAKLGQSHALWRWINFYPFGTALTRSHWFLRSDSCFCCCCSEDGTRTDYYTLFKNTNPKEDKSIWRSIRQFDLI